MQSPYNSVTGSVVLAPRRVIYADLGRSTIFDIHGNRLNFNTGSMLPPIDAFEKYPYANHVDKESLVDKTGNVESVVCASSMYVSDCLIDEDDSFEASGDDSFCSPNQYVCNDSPVIDSSFLLNIEERGEKSENVWSRLEREGYCSWDPDVCDLDVDDECSDRKKSVSVQSADFVMVKCVNCSTLDSDSVSRGGFFVSNGKPFSNLDDIPRGQLALFSPLLAGGVRGKKTKDRNTPFRVFTKGEPIPPNIPQSLHGNRFTSVASLFTNSTGNIDMVISLNDYRSLISGVHANGPDLSVMWYSYSVERVNITTFRTCSSDIVTGAWTFACDLESKRPSQAIPALNLHNGLFVRMYSGNVSPSFSIRPPQVLTSREADTRPMTIRSSSFYDLNSPPDKGFMYMKLEDGPVNIKWGTVLVEMFVVARHRRKIVSVVSDESFNASLSSS